MRRFDLVVIGSGPGGQKAAIQAAKLGKSVCVIERMDFVGGVAINTGTIPSKALREAVLDVLASRKALGSDGQYRPVDRRKTLEDLTSSCQRVIRAEIDLVRSQFASNGIELRKGVGTLGWIEEPGTPGDPAPTNAGGLDIAPEPGDKVVNVIGIDDSVETIRAGAVLIATGTTPAKPSSIEFDHAKVITSDELLKLPYLPSSMIVVGGGVIGTEYASMLAALGVRVTLVEGRGRLLEFIDAEICEALQYHLRQMGVTLRLGEKVVSIKRVPPPPGSRPQVSGPGVGVSGGGVGGASPDGELVEAVLESGKTLRAECLLYCIGRQGATEKLNLAAYGLEADNRGRISVDKHYQTLDKDEKPLRGVYAVGDVIGFPALASTSMEQGRLAACHMFKEHAESVPELFPYGIYSIPEISMVGWTEERLTQAGIPYEAGIAQYKETARGNLIGDDIGMLKMLIHQDSHAVLGVHVIGTNATEIVHIGQAVMAYQGTVEYFINTVFNYPTLAECYKIAAFNARNKLKSI